MMKSKIHINQRLQSLLSQYHRNSLFLFLCYSLFMLNDSNSLASTQPHMQCHEDERSALLQFTQSFFLDCSATALQDEYVNLPSFTKSKVASWNKYESAKNSSSNDCCTWDGVRCDDITGHVTELNLDNSCLYGNFPQNSSLFKLTHLRYLNLRGNNFKHSQIPHDFDRLPNLLSLILSMSRFSGQIPIEISRLSALHTLDLSYSSGIIDYDSDKLLKLHNPNLETLLNSLTMLRKLALDSVDISSTTTPVISHLSNRTSLRWLGLASTSLKGEFPSSIFQLPHLEHLDISNNDHLTGVLPEFLLNRRSYKLKDLALYNTGFSGKLPYSFGDHLIKLETVNLRSSRIIGEVPSSFVNLTRLRALDLSFTGITITPDFFNMLPKLNKLTVLKIRSLHFSEPIIFPSCFRNLTKLEYFGGNSGRLTGPIPSWISNLSKLRVLDLSNNSLSVTSVNIFLKLKNLKHLALDDMNLIFPPIEVTHNDTISSRIPQLHYLSLCNCNIKEVPEFLKYQHELQYIQMHDNSIHGLIPHWLGSTSKDTLQLLSMEDNFLTGFEQSDRPTILPWTNIQLLDLSNNRLQGPVPIFPISLSVYKLRNNSLTGDIPELICNSTLLVLDLSYNNLTGKVPECFDKFGDSLFVLDLKANRLQGSIPQNFSRSCKLEAINLSKNQLEGKLPRSLTNCSKLQLLDIGNNFINDTFPSWLGNLQELQILALRHNHFHGFVLPNIHPNSSINFLNLRILDLSNNFLTGHLPIEYWPSMRILGQDMHYMATYAASYVHTSVERFNYDYLDEFSTTNKGVDTTYSENPSILKLIDLSSNNFTGNIPNFVGNLIGLVGINFSHNDLAGEIPSSLKNITRLEWLDLSYNKLYGEIPNELTQMNFLANFNVSHNQLMGLIPHGKQFDTFDNSSFEGNQGLCGDPMSKSCEDVDNPLPSSPPYNQDDEEEDFVWVDWLVRFLGYGSGLVVGFVGGKIFTGRHHEWFIETFGRRHKKRKMNRTRISNR